MYHRRTVVCNENKNKKPFIKKLLKRAAASKKVQQSFFNIMEEKNMEKWVVAAKRADFQKIGQRFGIDPVIARLIRNRDLVTEKEIDRYLHGRLSDLHSWKLLKDIQKLLGILTEKIQEKKKSES